MITYIVDIYILFDGCSLGYIKDCPYYSKSPINLYITVFRLNMGYDNFKIFYKSIVYLRELVLWFKRHIEGERRGRSQNEVFTNILLY